MKRYLLLLEMSLMCFSALGQTLYPMGNEFPLVLYSLQSEFQDVSSIGWNGGHTYQSAPTSQDYFDTCNLYGLTAMARLSYIDSLGQKWPNSNSVVINEISQQLNNSNISWWDLPEECRYWIPNEMNIVQNYSILTKLHDTQNRPNFMYIPGHYNSTDIANYVPYLDIIPASCYTHWQHMPHAYVRWSIEQAYGAITNSGYSLGSDYSNNEKTVMAILELFEGDSSLTVEGTRHDFWLALACDVKGLLVFSHFYRNSSPSLVASWDELNNNVALFLDQNIDDVMLSGTNYNLVLNIVGGELLTPMVNIQGSPQAQFESIKVNSKLLNDTLYIIVVNSAIGVTHYTLSGFDLMYSDSDALDIMSNAHKQITNGMLQDSIPALGVKIYKIHPSLSALNIQAKPKNPIIIPNPVDRLFRISCTDCVENGVTAKLKIFELTTGVLVKSFKEVRLGEDILIHDLPSGIYLCKLSFNDDQSYIMKLIKM